MKYRNLDTDTGALIESTFPESEPSPNPENPSPANVQSSTIKVILFGEHQWEWFIGRWGNVSRLTSLVIITYIGLTADHLTLCWEIVLCNTPIWYNGRYLLKIPDPVCFSKCCRDKMYAAPTLIHDEIISNIRNKEDSSP